jgi:hypothetical protein
MAKVGLEDISGAAESYRQANRIAAEHVPELLARMTASMINWQSQLLWTAYRNGELDFEELERIYAIMLDEVSKLKPTVGEDVVLVHKTTMRLASRLNREQIFEFAWRDARKREEFGVTEEARDVALRNWLKSDSSDFENAWEFQCVRDTHPVNRAKASIKRNAS